MNDVGFALSVAMGCVLLIGIAAYGLFWINRREEQNKGRTAKPDSKFRRQTKRICFAAWLLANGTYALSSLLKIPQLAYLAWMFAGVFILSVGLLIGGAMQRRQA